MTLLKQALSILLFLFMAINLNAQDKNQVIDIIYDDPQRGPVDPDQGVFKKFKQGAPKKLNVDDKFMDHAHLIFLDKDALIFYLDTFSNGTFSLDKKGNIVPISINTGSNLNAVIDEVVNGERKQLRKKDRKDLMEAYRQGLQNINN